MAGLVFRYAVGSYVNCCKCFNGVRKGSYKHLKYWPNISHNGQLWLMADMQLAVVQFCVVVCSCLANM